MADMALQYMQQAQILSAALGQCRIQNLSNPQKIAEIDDLLTRLAQAQANFQPSTNTESILQFQRQAQSDILGKYRAQMESNPSRSDSELKRLAMGQGLDGVQAVNAVRRDELFEKQARVNAYATMVLDPLQPHGQRWNIAVANGEPNVAQDIIRIVNSISTIPTNLRADVASAIAKRILG